MSQCIRGWIVGTYLLRHRGWAEEGGCDAMHYAGTRRASDGRCTDFPRPQRPRPKMLQPQNHSPAQGTYRYARAGSGLGQGEGEGMRMARYVGFQTTWNRASKDVEQSHGWASWNLTGPWEEQHEPGWMWPCPVQRAACSFPVPLPRPGPRHCGAVLAGNRNKTRRARAKEFIPPCACAR